MAVPSVTIDDLQSFHAKHLLQTSALAEQVPQTDGDDLGYYPDGVKRTLTDVQVAIFRHSEIQEMIKEHNLRLANSDYDDSSNENEEGSERKESSSRTEESRLISTKIAAEPIRKNRKRKRGKKTNMDPRANPDDFMDDGEERTFRRICREMDEQKAQEVDLDY